MLCFELLKYSFVVDNDLEDERQEGDTVEVTNVLGPILMTFIKDLSGIEVLEKVTKSYEENRDIREKFFELESNFFALDETDFE